MTLLGRLAAGPILLMSTSGGLHTSGAAKPLPEVHFLQDSDVKCLSYAVEAGNPDTGPSTHILKFPKGCGYPWHYHTAEEQLMVVQGTVSVQMDKSAAELLATGGFAFMPSKVPHRFSCVSEHGCFAFVHFDRAYDIFWMK